MEFIQKMQNIFYIDGHIYNEGMKNF